MSALAAEFDMFPGEEVPLMSVDITSIREQPITGPQPLFRELPYEERHIHAEIMADAFEAPVGLVRQFIDIISGSPGFRAFIAEVDGEPVSTAVSVLAGESSGGIFNVATPEAHRRHGYGAAVTTHAIRASVSPLTTSAWLQSSPAGLAVYQRIGFETVEIWPTWTSSAST
jgi:ribosomal protein S18 acetylase RimI-like enzyme